MGGFASTVIDGHPVEYGDICEVEVWGAGDGPNRMAVTFVEVSDDGDMWFRCLCDHDSVRGSDTFADYYNEIGEVRFMRKANDVRADAGSGI